MVFQHIGGKAVVNGKALVPDAKNEDLERIGKHIKLTHEQLRSRYAPEHRQSALGDVAPEPQKNFDEECAENERVRVSPDPYGPMDAIASMDVFERQRIVHDQGAYVDTWLGEIAVIAKEREWLQGQTNDPRWIDHPGRPDAIKKIESMESRIGEIADSISWAEGWADRCWQTMSPEERTPVCHMWLTQPTDERLVTRSWKDQAHYGYRWPKGFYVNCKWFLNLPERMYFDLQSLWVNGITWLGEPIEIEEQS